MTSEYVSVGHPDKVADYIVSYLLDRYMERDPKVRFALECQVKDSHVTLGGEVTSVAEFSDGDITGFVRDAVREVGYTAEYAARWPEGATLNADEIDVRQFIGRQSPDIAQGVDADGWGDQGIFWGMATADAAFGQMPPDHFIAKELGRRLYRLSLGGRLATGLDVKTQVSMRDGRVLQVVVAVPSMDAEDIPKVRQIALDTVRAHSPVTAIAPQITVNGTGAYVRHASVGDCGTTGRKLAVDLYGGNCRIGGGCPWGKDPTKADVSLNAYARSKALGFIRANPTYGEVHCAISCRIGSPVISLDFFDARMNRIAGKTEADAPCDLIAELGLDRPMFAARCRDGLFEGLPAARL